MTFEKSTPLAGRKASPSHTAFKRYIYFSYKTSLAPDDEECNVTEIVLIMLQITTLLLKVIYYCVTFIML